MPVSRKSSSNLGLILFLLLLVVAVFLFWEFRQTQAPPITAATAPAIDRGLVYAGEPRPIDPDTHLQILRNTGYVVGYSNERKDPLWVAYRLFRVDHPPVLRRPSGFEPDMRTVAHVTSEDYVRSGFDRGHMAPNHAIATRYGEEAQRETFLMSNVTPQLHAINAGAWEKLEAEEADDYADRFEQIWIFDGPLFDAHPATIRDDVEVPRGFYKIIIREINGQPDTESFIMPQPANAREVNINAQPGQYQTTLKDVETESQLEFFPELAPADRQKLESVGVTSSWATGR